MDNNENRQDSAKLLNHTQVHVSKKAKSEDNRSTGYSFLTVGGIVLLLVVLCNLGILGLPFSFSEQPVMAAVLAAMGLGFIAGGFFALRKAKEYLAESEAEEYGEETLKDAFYAAFDAASVDAAAGADEDLSPEILCLKRMELIEEKLKALDPSITDSHAQALCEEIYDKLFEA